MDEAVRAERVIILNKGTVLLDGTPEEVFKEHELIRSVNLDVPMAVELGAKLRSRGIKVPEEVVTIEEMVEFVCQYK